MEVKDTRQWLLVRIITPEGLVYENLASRVRIVATDGILVIYKNYSPVLERLKDGNVNIMEKKKIVAFDLREAWLTMSNNICSIYSFSARALI